ncbi:hypothetical protein NC653_034466 [Populus alba x Populus x berolinensis]|uniref:Integrase catalytic domain-containing protein n=1 Tax=Populus alba x Populus x berolinensis TaxID=444605 RepID=A0AAD6LML1_9ROSI|nr:hypothetical protein NC653_034466 [Populus alba x Populus x berolinensis]
MDFLEIDILVLQEPQLNEMDFLEIDLLGPQPIFSETVQPVENLQFGVGGFSQLDQWYDETMFLCDNIEPADQEEFGMINVRKLSVYDDNCYIVVVGSGMEDGNIQEQVNRNLSEDKSCMPSSKQEPTLIFSPMDSPPAAVVAISPSTGAAPSPVSPLPAVGRDQLPHVSDFSSHDSAVPLPLMGTQSTTMVPLSNTHHVVSLKLMNTNYLYWRMQMKPYLLGQGVFHFVDGSLPCPPSHMIDASAGSSSAISPSFLRWKQQDQLILSALLSSLSMDVLHLVVDCSTSHCVWRTLEKTLASPSNSRIMQLHSSFQDLRQGDASVSMYMQQAKSLFDELAAAGRPMSLEDFNLYVFRGLRGEFKDLVTSLITKAELLSYADLHSHLLTHEFLHKNSFHSMAVGSSSSPLLSSSSLLQQPPLLPTPPISAYYAMTNHSRNGGRSRDWRQNQWQNRRPSAADFRPNQGQWSGHVHYQLCSNPGHSALQCSQFRSSTQQPSAHLAVANDSAATTWFLDIGANQHVMPDLATLTDSAPYLGNDFLHVGDGEALDISHVGHTTLYSPKRLFTLTNVLRVPHITKPLLSVQKFYRDNHVYFEFHDSVFYVKDLVTKEVLLSGRSHDGLYVLSESSATSVPQAFWSPCISATADLWHRRLGKSSRLSLRPMGHKTSTPLELIFSDVWGPAPMFSSDGFCYFVIFVDAHTKYIWYYPLVAKSDVFSTFQRFQTLVERQFSLKIKSVQTDWGGEYRKLNKFFQTIGIHHRLICPHTHEQNGTVERRHRHIVETGLTLLGQCNAPLRFWNYAMESSVYLINRMPTHVLQNKSPFACLFHRTPDYNFLRTFGCLCFPFLRPYHAHKLDFRSSPCVFLGYSSSHLGYRCLDLEFGRVYVSRHVCFHECVFPFKKCEQVTTPPVSPTPPTYLPSLQPPSCFQPLPSQLGKTHNPPLPLAATPQLASLPVDSTDPASPPTQPYYHHVLVFPMIIVQEQHIPGTGATTPCPAAPKHPMVLSPRQPKTALITTTAATSVASSVSINLADGVVFVGAGDPTIATIFIVAMDQLTVLLQDNNIAHMETSSHLTLFHGQQLATHHMQANANLAFNTASSTTPVTWFLDTGANYHVTSDLVSMTSSKPYLGNDHLHVGDGKGLVISNIAHSKIRSPNRMFTLSNILHVPTIKKPLLSVQKFYLDNNIFFEFHSSLFYVKDLMTKEVLSGQIKDGLYVLSASSATSLPQAFSSTCLSTSADVWHRRLGHPSPHILHLLVKNKKVSYTST